MAGPKVNRVTNWRSLKPRPELQGPPAGTSSVTESSILRNPWRFESDRWTFNPHDITILQPGRKRRRTFTGSIDAKLVRFPTTHREEVKRKLFRIALIAFIAADLTLAFVFLASLV